MTWAMKIADERDEAYSIGREQGLEAGQEQGFEQGICQTKLETAQKLLSMGLSPEQVAEGTGLTLETIQELSNAIDKYPLIPTPLTPVKPHLGSFSNPTFQSLSKIISSCQGKKFSCENKAENVLTLI